MNNLTTLSKKEVANSFSKFASSYDQHAIIQKEIGQRLLDRALSVKKSPLCILDLGSGPGSMFNALHQAYPKAKIYGLDMSWGMVQKAKKGFWQSLIQKTPLIQGDMEDLPFKQESFDLIFSNCAFQWSTNLNQTFKEAQRLLAPLGNLFFSTFGPDTLYELKELWAQVDTQTHVHSFMDMHLFGDLMLKNGLNQPVVDQEHLTLTYSNLQKLLHDLKYTGARNLSPNRRRGLTSPLKIKQLEQAFEASKRNDDRFHLTYEVVYGHATKKQRAPKMAQPIPLHFK